MGAQAYTTGYDVALRDPSNLHAVAHEAAHVVQQRAGVQLKGGIDTHGDAHEQHADAVAERVVQGRSAEDLLAPYAAGTAAPDRTVQRYTEPGENSTAPWNRLSDDGRMAVSSREGEAWATPDLIAQSNTVLDANHSKAKIDADSGSTKTTTNGRTHYLKKLKMVDRDAGIWDRTFGDDEVNLVDDCGGANGQMMGAEHARRRAFQAATKNGGKQELTNESAYRLDDRAAGGDLSTTEELSGQVYVRMMKREFNLSLTRQAALDKWQALTDAQRDALSRKYGINQYAAPKVGQGVTIGTEYDMPGYKRGPRPEEEFNFHFALNLMQSGTDYVSLEDFAGSEVPYYFNMYGPASKAQSFADEDINAGAVGNRSTAMVVVHPHMTDGRTNKAVKLADATTKEIIGTLEKGTAIKIVQSDAKDLEIEVIGGSLRGRRGVIPAGAFAN